MPEHVEIFSSSYVPQSQATTGTKPVGVDTTFLTIVVFASGKNRISVPMAAFRNDSTASEPCLFRDSRFLVSTAIAVDDASTACGLVPISSQDTTWAAAYILPSLAARAFCITCISLSSRRSRELRRQSSTTSSYVSYSVYRQTMAPSILKDADVTHKVLEYVLDSPNGRRSLSRMARTCKVLCEPALNLLWKELDSLIPLISLFPNHLFKRSRRPGLGLAIMPIEEDWNKLLAYGHRVRRLTYDESSKSVSPSIFPILEEYRPRTYILPNLTTLVWRAETPAGLDRCQLFLNTDLQGLVLEIGTRFPQLATFFTDLSLRTRLTSLSVMSPTSLPDDFSRVLAPQTELEKLVLVAPGALSPGVGKWASSLPILRSLQVDLTGRAAIAVEGFFDDIEVGSDTPASPDSGVFSGEDIDFSDIKKSTLRLTEDRAPLRGAFVSLRHLHLTGEVSNVVVFLKHLACPVSQLELVIEDPFDRADWQDLCILLCESFGDSLQSLRVSASGASRFVDLVRSTSRAAEFTAKRLSLDGLSFLPALARFEIDLPESVTFHNSDLARIAQACPNIEILRLCPVARFPISAGPPSLTLEGLAYLTTNCRRLHTLALVVNGQPGTDEIFNIPSVSSRSLLRLHVGHSWIRDPLQAAILISHLAPYADYLKWFHEKNRPGYIETHAQGWARVAEILPHLQAVRLVERRAAAYWNVPEPPQKVDKAIHATPESVSRGVWASVNTIDAGIQFSPSVVSRFVEAKPALTSTSIQAIPSVMDQEIDAVPNVFEKSVDARPAVVSREVSAIASTATKYVHAVVSPESSTSSTSKQTHYPRMFVPPVVSGAVSMAWRAMVFGPNFVTARLYDVWSLTPFRAHTQKNNTMFEKVTNGNVPETETEKTGVPEANGTSNGDISPGMDTDTDTGTKLDCDSHAYDSMNTNSSNYVSYDTHAAPLIHTSIAVDESPSQQKQVRTKEHMQGLPAELFIGTSKKGRPLADHAGTRQSATVDCPSSSYKHFYTMAEHRKQEKDYTKEVDEILPQSNALAESGRLQDALDTLFALEKQTRNASDLMSTTRLVKTIVEIAYAARDYEQLNSAIHVLCKKQGQLKGAIQAMVELAMTWLEEIRQRDGVEKWLQLVETLRSVTDGKLFLETPRARVTLLLSHYHESLSQNPTPTSPPPRESLITASDLLSELQVETYSSMERREKTEFILEQMRLLIKVAQMKDEESGKEGKDPLAGGETEWVKVRVGSRKVNETSLQEKDNEELKLKFYDMMVQHGLRNSAYLDVAKYYHKVWETPSIKEDVSVKGRIALEHIVCFVVLAPHDNEQSDMMHRLFNDPALAKLELYYNLLKSFTTPELMRWPGVETIYGPYLRETAIFSQKKHWDDLRTRAIEHNIRVIAKYYTRITLSRLTSLLDLSPEQTEETLCRLVVSGTVWARIDRPTGVVNFQNKRSAEDVMNDWSSDMQKLLDFVEKTWMGMNAAQAAQSRVKA
ncbi:hypothetical protein EW146_g2441 [Bondarzewia mesenterica]|uniref:PCI domain-containing protein n=1 Tax=Bondarzewia mesenterica TaxID=1095465 RepID=A0A4S4M6T3_9AGAM|nr:hypothetical protein EW146_g2441 [Bondarzewia mesenterica]